MKSKIQKKVSKAKDDKPKPKEKPEKIKGENPVRKIQRKAGDKVVKKSAKKTKSM